MRGEIIGAVRRNHALEHATVAVLMSRRGPTLRLVGRAAPDGFYLYGNVPEAELAEAAAEALERLQRGEAQLAVTPLCGTNLAVAGTLAGLASLLAMGSGDRWQRLPNVLLGTLLAVVAAQPLGRWVQQHLTTSPDLSGTRIVGIRRGGSGRRRSFKVETASR